MLRLSKHDINYQLVPPAVHGVNPAESAICAFKTIHCNTQHQ